MSNPAPSPNLQTIVVQVPKESSPPNWIEIAHGIESVVTIIGLIVGAWWALWGYWRTARAERRADQALREKERQQREDQLAQQKTRLKWDQTQMAYKINNEFLSDPEAQEALGLVDADSDSHEMVDRSDSSQVLKYSISIKTGEHVRAMRTDVSVADKKEIFLRDCFDAWFYWMAVMEQYLQNGLISQQDIAYPSDYYVRYLKRDVALYRACEIYIDHYKLTPLTKAFLARFPKD